MLTDLVDLVLPRRCIGCAVPGHRLCAVCTPTAAAFAVECGGLPVRAACVYDGAVRRAVLAYKERGRRDLAGPLAVLLAEAVRALGSGPPVVLVTPPSSRAAAAARGGDHMRRLARRAAGPVSAGTAPGVLRAVRRVRDSAGLGVDERRRNLHRSLPRVRRTAASPSSSTTS